MGFVICYKVVCFGPLHSEYVSFSLKSGVMASDLDLVGCCVVVAMSSVQGLHEDGTYNKSISGQTCAERAE